MLHIMLHIKSKATSHPRAIHVTHLYDIPKVFIFYHYVIHALYVPVRKK